MTIARPAAVFAAVCAAALAPSAALAHDGPAGHAHPHGVETVAFALLALGAVWAARRALR